MVENKSIFVPKLDHEIQYSDWMHAITDFCNGDTDYFNVSSVPYKERINIFSVVRDQSDVTKYIISDCGGDVISPFHENSPIDYSTIRHDIMRIIKDFEDRYGKRKNPFIYIGGKFT